MISVVITSIIIAEKTAYMSRTEARLNVSSAVMKIKDVTC